ncbi:hypothetical protein D3C73_1165380 [compost metagenome]
MNRVVSVEGSQTKEIRSWSCQINFQSIFVNCFNAYLTEVCNFFFIIFLCIFDVVQLIRIRRGRICFRAQNTFPCKHEIICSYCIAVTPFCIFTKMESVLSTIYIPAFCSCRFRLAISIHTSKTFIHRFQNCVSLAVLSLRRIECWWFST